MTCAEIRPLLDDFVDHELSAEREAEISRHLHDCAGCAGEVDDIRRLLARLSELPDEIAPGRDLWGPILARIAHPSRLRINHSPADGRSAFRPSRMGFALAAAILGVVAVLWFLPSPSGIWQVSRLEGFPRIDSSPFEGSSTMRAGSLLETDATSRARISVGKIGRVEVEPGSRLRLIEAASDNQKMALERGTIVASTWAPPRLFSVETPSGVAVDLGCAYRLMVDNAGRSFLLVTAGSVSLEWGGRLSIIPSAMICETRPGVGPGTPYRESAPERFRASLEKFDFTGDESCLDTIVSACRRDDAVTLWHLIRRADMKARPRVYARLAALVPPSPDITENGILNLDRDMMRRWWREFETASLPDETQSPAKSFWSFLRKTFSI